MGAKTTTKTSLNAVDCGLPAGSPVYVKRWHCCPSPCYLWGHYHNVVSVWAKLSSGLILKVLHEARCTLMLQMLEKDTGEQKKKEKKICPNIYSNWQFWHLTMQPRTDSTNLTNLCVGCKQTAEEEDNDSPSVCPSAFLLSCHCRHLQRINVKWAKWIMLWTVCGRCLAMS